MNMVLNKLPDEHEEPRQLEDMAEWFMTHAHEITILTVKNTKQPRIDVLMALLNAVRFVNRARYFKKGTFINKEASEKRLRAEIHDMPEKFCFGLNELREYNPIHLGEMIQFLIRELAKQGYDAKVNYEGLLPPFQS